MRTEYGVVEADMHVVRVLTEIGGIDFGYVSVGLVLAGRHAISVGERSGFLERLFGEVARHDVIRFAIDAYIERNGGELRGRASLNEDDVIVLGYREQLTEQALRSVVDLLIRLGTMAHFHDAHAGAVIIDQLLLHFFKYGKREHGRTRGKIVNSHVTSPMYQISYHYTPKVCF